ncbi:M20 family metallo-hydrolase [Halomonas huangheensis]|uniref:Peptidase M20 dimerisation domain-containing protein n=1 Tax=Halomonas huangheensis TaxID=1178482 RepID=W1NC39_9GAMM|nr:M20 family metallo-hydrolase [Halomonas huangheensis]ALM52706.1 Zn-dependent hydrolase [Halomonas huangheensis]ERL52761.1 hypothetical protein BJB45_15895 [Halomonas huangheensis]
MQQDTTFGSRVDTRHFWLDLQHQARIGALPQGGLGRLALDNNDIQARLWLINEGQKLGCQAFFDPLGNVYLRREGLQPDLAPLLIGSHLDSQPSGGIYDGTLGVLSGLAVLRTLQQQGTAHQRAIEVVSWTNEEGARFTPGTSGSSWFSGKRELAEILPSRDHNGVTFGDALSTCLSALEGSGAHARSTSYSPYAYLESHIEQGPVLDASGLPVCAVSGIQGVNWYHFELTGIANHAGTTPMDMRCDALMAAHALISELNSIIHQHHLKDGQLRFTIGKFAVAPNSINTIADRVSFGVDLRHPTADVLATIDEEFQRLAQHRWNGCDTTLQVLSRIPPVTFDAGIASRLERNIANYAPQAPKLVSGAFHDAIHIAHLCPSAMLFVACRNGISHHPDEHVDAQDAAVAVRALSQTAFELIMQ